MVAIRCRSPVFEISRPVTEPGRVRRAEQERIELLRHAFRVADATRLASAVAEEDSDGLARVTADAEDRHARGVAAITQLDHVAVAQAVLIGERRMQPGRGVPGDFRQWFRELLQPPVVGEAAVPHRGIRPEDDLEPRRRRWRCGSRTRVRCRWCGCRRRLCRRCSGCGRCARDRECCRSRRGRRHEWRGWSPVRDRRAPDETVVKRMLPELIGVGERFALGVAEAPALPGERACPVILHDVELRAS